MLINIYPIYLFIYPVSPYGTQGKCNSAANISKFKMAPSHILLHLKFSYKKAFMFINEC